LDPLSAKVQVANILAGLIKADPTNATYFASNAASLDARFDALDHDFRIGLQNRTKNDFVTTHEGFDYLALRYGLSAHAAVGISADQEPSPADLATLTNLVRSLGLHYVFSEPVFSDAVVRTIAAETGAQVLVLDGIHGRTGAHAGMDYFQIMYANLAELRIGLEVTA
jgi:zinc transport system substrate-binding protein